VNLALWIIAGILAAAFLFAGGNKIFTSYRKLTETRGAGWTNDFSPLFIKLLGAVEVLGGLGLILPGAFNIATILTPLAASGIAVIMVGAGIVELRRHEPRHALLNLAYFALAVFVAWGRFAGVPFR
jgi:hypothetical protein